MIKIIDNRGTGKTSRLLLLAKENRGTVVCANPQLLTEKAYRYGIVGVNCVSYITYLNNKEKFDKQKIFIDDVEQFLKVVTVNQIEGFVVNTDD